MKLSDIKTKFGEGTDFDLDYGFKKTDPLKSVPSEKKKTIQEAIDKKLGK